MIYLKLIMATVLSALPFVLASFIRKKRKYIDNRSIFDAVQSLFAYFNKIETICFIYILRLYEGMTKSDNFRKFFTLLVLLFMIAVQFIDFNASTDIAKEILNTPDNVTDDTSTTTIEVWWRNVSIFIPLMTNPLATLLAAALSMILFAYRCGNWLLTRLHNNNKFFFYSALVSIVILFASPRFLIVTEVIEIFLIAAIIYPNKIVSDDPGSRKGVPVITEEEKHKNAA